MRLEPLRHAPRRGPEGTLPDRVRAPAARPRAAAVLLAAVLVGLAGPAPAELVVVEPAAEPLLPPPVPRDASERPRFEWAPFPSIGGNTDVGFTFGVDLAMARFEPGYSPYRYRLGLVAQASVKEGPDGVDFPAHAYRFTTDLTGLAGGRLRLSTQLGFERVINSGYFGLAGMSSPDPRGRLALDAERGVSVVPRRFQYLWQGPRAGANVRWILRGLPFELLVGAEYRYLMPAPYAGSLLDEDLSWSREGGRPVLRGGRDHSLAQLRVGILWDGRDNEFAPSRGRYLELSVRAGLGVPADEPFGYGGLTADLRTFVPLLGRRLVLAARLVADLLLGEAPFYELSSMGSFQPLPFCGSEGIRGCPDGRHSAVAKVLGALELRSLFAPFRLFGMDLVFGMMAALSLGQTWATLEPEPPFVDSGPAVSWGAGGGLLLGWGEAVMVRIEVAYSPDATDAGMPVGIYFELDFAY